MKEGQITLPDSVIQLALLAQEPLRRIEAKSGPKTWAPELKYAVANNLIQHELSFIGSNIKEK